MSSPNPTTDVAASGRTITGNDETSRPFAAARIAILTWLSCFALLALVFLPVFIIPYAHHDQYRHFHEQLPGDPAANSCKNEPQYPWLYSLGRPIAAETECVIFKFTARLSDLIFFRFWVLACLALAAAFHATLLRRLGLNLVASVALAVATFALPGAQNAIFMTNFANALTPLAATVSYLVLLVANKPHAAGNRMRVIGLTVLAGVLLLVALFTYPFMAFFFFCGTLGSVLFMSVDEWRLRVWRVVRDILFFSIAALVYFTVAKLALFPRSPAAIARMPEWYRPVLAFGGIGKRFLQLVYEDFPRVLTLWHIYPSRILVTFFLFALAAGVFFWWRQPAPRSERTWDGSRAVTVLTPLLLLLVANVPYLLIPALFLHRLFFASSAMLLLLLFWSATQIVGGKGLAVIFGARRIQDWIAIAVCGVGCLIASINTTLNALNSHLEFAAVKGQIAAARDRNVERIHVVRPRTDSSFNGFAVIDDEFNRPTTEYPFDITNLVRAALVEMRAHSKRVLDGSDWMRAAGNRNPCEISWVSRNQFRLTNEVGDRIEAVVENGRIVAPGWHVWGSLTSDMMAILWSNGTLWAKREGKYRMAGVPWIIVRPGARNEAGGSSSSVSLKPTSRNEWLLSNEGGMQTRATLSGSELTAPGWGIVGRLVMDPLQIRWSNGTIWERQNEESEHQIPVEDVLAGEWVMLDAYPAGELLVTSSGFGEPVLRTPNMVLVDMNPLLDSVWGWPTPNSATR
jgi:hypothetical protein